MKRLIILLGFIILSFGVKAQTVAYCGPYTATAPLTLTSANNNQTIRGDSIGNGSTQGIYINGANNIHITKCKIVNITNFAIHILNSTNITIDSCDIRNVGMGVYVEGSSSATIKVNLNYFKDINGINSSYLGHAIQFNSIATGGGNQINYNRIENVKNITDTSSHPHDQINVYHCSGVVGDSIQIIGNWIRGGQRTAWPSSGYTGCGIACADQIGSYQVVRNNIMVRPGCAGIQAVQSGGTVNGIAIDHNQIYNDLVSTVAAQGITITGTVSAITMNYNRIWWKNKNGNAVQLTDGETSYYFGNPNGTLTGVTVTGNTFLDTSLDPSVMLPSSMLFSSCSTTTAPAISYSPSVNTYMVGTAITNLTPTNTGGAATSWAVSPALPSGLSLSASTGVLSGTPTVTSSATNYTVTATNSIGSGNATLNITTTNSSNIIVIKRKIIQL